MNKRKLITRALDDLFCKPEPSPDVIRDYLAQLHSNLVSSEKMLSRNYVYIVLVFLSFLLLDTGLISKIGFDNLNLTSKKVF